MDELRRAAAALLAASLLAPPPAAAAGYRRAAAPLQGEARVPAFDVSVGGADERLSAAALLSAAPLSLDGPAPSIESVAPAPTRAVALPALIEEAGPKEQLVQEKTPPATPTRTQPPAESGSAPKVGSEAFQRSLSRSVAAPTARLAQDVPTMTFGSAKTAAEEPFEAPARRGDGPAEPVGAGLPAMLASSGLGRSDAAAGKTTPRGEPPAAPAPARAGPLPAWLRVPLLVAAILPFLILPPLVHTPLLDVAKTFATEDMGQLFLGHLSFSQLALAAVPVTVLLAAVMEATGRLFPHVMTEQDGESLEREWLERPGHTALVFLPLTVFYEEGISRLLMFLMPAALLALYLGVPAAPLFALLSFGPAYAFARLHGYSELWPRVFAALLFNAILAMTGSLFFVMLIHYLYDLYVLAQILWEHRRDPA